MALLRAADRCCSGRKPSGDGHDRPPLHRRRRGGPAAVRRLRPVAEARLTMFAILLYAAGAAVVAVYMLAALVFPEKF
jgi:hypothetical protein